MPNEIVDFHRKRFPGDKRSDVELTVLYTTQLGVPWVEANGKKVPNFYRDYRTARYGNESELGKAWARGSQGAMSSVMGGVGLALEAVPGDVGFIQDWKKSAMQTATEFGEGASSPRIAPREPDWSNVETAGQAADYFGALFGEAAPSIVESVAVGAAGALAGSTVPGPGTIAGGITGIVGKTAIKKVLKDAVAKKLKDLTEDQVKNALAKKGSKKIISQVDDLVKRRAKAMTAQYGAATANALNSYGLSSGEIYNELANDPTVDPDDAFNISLSFGAVAALPDTILPSLVLKRMGVFDRIAGVRGATSTAASRSGFMRYLTRFLPTAAQATGIEAATEGFQEYVNISAEKYAKDLPFDLSSEEIDRIRRAAALGAAGGFMVSPMAAINIREEADKFTTEEGEELGPDAKPVAPRKKLVVPAPAAPIAPEVDARLMQLALLYLQGKVQSDPELSKEYFEAKKDLAQRQRLMELQAEFRDQIAADKLASEEAAEGWTKTLAKVLKKEPLTDEEAAQVVSRGGQIIEAGGAKFGSSPEAMNDPEAQEDLDPEAAETPTEDTAEPAETAVVPPEVEAEVTEADRVAEVERPDEPAVIPDEAAPETTDVPLAPEERAKEIQRIEEQIKQLNELVAHFSKQEIKPTELTEGEIKEFPKLYDALVTREVLALRLTKLREGVDEPAVIPDESEVMPVEVVPDEAEVAPVEEPAAEVVEEPAEVGPVEFDYGKTLNPFIATAKSAPQPPVSEVNKFIEADIAAKEARIKELQEIQNQAAFQLEELKAYFRSQAPEETMIGDPLDSTTVLGQLQAGVYALQDRVNKISSQISIQGKRIERLKESLVAEDSFIDAATGQVITAASLSEDSLAYEDTVPLSVERREDTAYGETKVSFSTIDRSITGGQAAPAYYEIDPDTVDSYEQAAVALGVEGQNVNGLAQTPLLDAQSVTKDAKGGTRAANDVRRLTAFLNKETGEVFVLGTGKQRLGKAAGEIVFYVDRGKGKKGYLTQEDVASQGNLIPFASMRLTSPRSKPMFYYESLGQYREVMGNAPARLIEAKDAALKSAASVQTGDVSQDKSPSQLAAEKSAIELTMLLTAQPTILESAYDAIDAGEEIAEADYEALVEVATVLIAGRAKQGDLSGIQSLEAAGVSLDNPQEIHEYLGEQWLIKFNEVKRLADETENPKETFINILTSEAGLQPQPVREEAPRQIESDIGRQDPTRPDQIHESRRRRRPSKLARLYQRLPQEAVRSLEEGDLAAAAYVAGEVRRTIQDSEPEPRTLTERVDLDKKIKVAEGEALQKWAAENGMMSDRDAFLEAYEEGGGQGGVEHKIIFEGEVVRKANDISMHATWSAYFERLAITNFLFPEAPYELVGFSFLPEHPKLASLGTGQADTLHAISTQPTVESGRRESALHDMQRQNPAYVGYVKEMHARIDEKLMELGFFPVTKDASKFGLLTAERKSGFHYYNPELGIQISDLHSGNAYITPEENLAVFDADAISPDQLQFGQGGFLKGLPEPDRSAHSQRNRDIKKKLSREDQIREDAARTYDHPDDTILEKRRKNKAKREIQLREDHEWIKARQRNRPDSKIPSAWKSAIAKESKDNRVTVSAFEGKNGFGEVLSWKLRLRVGVDEDVEAAESIVTPEGNVLRSSAAWPKAVWEKTDAVHPSPRKPTAFRKILKHIIQTHEEGSRETAMAEKLLAMEDPPLVVVTDGTMDENAHYSRGKEVEGGTFYEGTYRAVDHVITLNDWNHDSSMIEVFLHEAWHARTLNAINFVVGSSRASEEFVKTLTPALEGKAPNEVVEIMGKTPGGRFNRNIKLIHKEGQAKWEAFNRLVDLANEKQFKGWRLSDILEFLHEEPANSGFLRSHDFNNLNKKELVGILRAVHELDDTDYRFLDYLFERTSEFAVGITNPGMVAVLNAMEASDETRVSEKRRSLWDKVVQAFADLFGAAKGSLLESSIAETLGFHYNDRNKNIKFSPREAVDPLSPSNEQVRQQFYASLQSLATAGVNVQVLETGLKSQLGMYVDRAIQLVVPDLANPTKDTVRLLLHEAGHQLFDDMSIGLQGIYHKAIKNLTDAELQVETERLAGSIAPDNPIDETTQEERLVDSVARELTDAGFDPSIARSMVQRVLAYLRELYLRAYIEVQKALLGPEHVNGEKARQYFKLRLESYLTKNYSPNAITMMGGAPMTAEGIGQARRSDRSDVTKVYDFNTGIVELKEIEAETLEDVLWNSRRRVKFLEDGTSEEIPIDPKPELSRLKVVEEYMEETYSEMYDMWNQAGLNLDGVSLEDFVKNTLKTKMPSEKIEALIKEGARADATLDNLEETSARPRAAKQIFIRLKKAKAKFEAAKGKAYSAKSESALKRSQNIADKLKEFQTKYTDLTTYTKNIVGIIDQALKEYTTGTKASKPHIVSRILKKLDPKYKYKNYKSDLEKARKRALNMEDVLAAIGDMDLDFVGTDPEELAVQIRDALGDSTPGNKVKDNVVIASLLGFAKRYPEAMILLQLRGEKNRARVDQAIRLMLSDNVAGISEARRLLRETITKTRQGERLHQRILVLKRKIRSIFDQQDKLQRQVDAGVAVGPLLTQRSEEVSALFEAEEAVKASQWEPMHSTWFYVPPSPEATVDEIWDNKENRQTIKLSPDEDFGRITKIIEMQTAWLKANGDVGERHGLIKRQRDGLMEVQADFTQHQLRQNVVTRMVGDRASKMEGIGGPQAKQIARRDRRFVSLLHTYGGNLTQQKGVAWAKAEKEAVKATGSYNLDEFKNRFYAPFLTFAAENTEILESFPGNVKAAENEVIRKAKIYLSDRTNGESDKAWPQLEKLFRLTASRNGFVDNMRDKMGVKVLEEVKIGGRVKRFFRTTIGSPLFSIMRRTKDNTELMYNFMRQFWGDTRIRKQEILEAAEAGPEALAALFEGRFEDRVMEEFVEPIMNRPKGAFPMPEAAGGENFDPAEISEAWDATEGLEGEEKIIQFAYNLAQQAITAEEQLAPAVADILKVFPRYFGQLRKLYEKKAENKSMNPVPVHTMMDARIAQNFPSEWLDYSTYTEREMRYYAESLAYEAAYGRDLVGIFSDFDELRKVLSNRASDYKIISSEVMRDSRFSRTQKEREIGRRANAVGGIRLLKGAAKDLDVVNTEESRFRAILKNKAEQLEYNASMELVSALTGATVQGMTTAITDMSTALEGPFRKFGLSSFGLSALFKNIKYTSLEAIGTLIQLLPISWNVNAERVKRRTRLGIVDDDSLVSFRERYVSNMADEFRSTGMTGKAMEAVSRAVKTVLQAGIGKAKRKDQLYTTLKAAPFTMFVNWQSAGSTDSLFDLFTDFVGRAGEFFDNNPAAMADENYQLTAKDLGLKDRLFGLIQNEKAFEYIVNTLQQHGLNPTRLGREWVLNGKTNPLTDEHYRRIAALSATEIMLENTAVTQPSWMMSNKMALMARPLLRWGFIKTGDLAKQLPMIADLQNLNIKDPNTRKALKAYRDFGMAMAMAIIPISLAWAMVRDKYEEEALGKRANLMRFGEANPFFVVLDRLDRVGTFGMAGEMANTLINMDNARQFGIDNRVFAVNSVLSLNKAMGTWIRQGEATYATVGRPAMMALGFGGALQNFQLSNHLLGLDNFESRYAARTNVNNILRSAGKELGLDVRKFSGGGALPTPMKPWMTEMVLSAYANDGIAFRNAYGMALKAAEAMGKEDPVKSVKSSLTMYHPLRYVFRSPPLEDDFSRIQRAAGGTGRQAINEAVSLFNRYAEMLGITPYMGKKAKKSGAVDLFKKPSGFSVPRVSYKSFSVDKGSLLPF